MRYVWINGEIRPEREACVSVYDSALMFGDMVFEMTRSFKGKHFKLKEHLERLFRSMKYLRIQIPFSIDELEEACHAIAKKNEEAFENDDEHRLMIDVTRGVLGLYEDHIETAKGPNVIITDFPLRWTTKGMGYRYEKGINMVVTGRSVPHDIIEPKLKHRSRINLLMANIKASLFMGEAWALLTDDRGFITEGSGDNFFIVKDETVITPREHSILRGISREYIKYLCEVIGCFWKEDDITVYDIMEADEAFVTGTPFCILPVRSVDGLKIGSGPNIVSTTFSLLRAWSEKMDVDIVNQIRTWDEQHVASQRKTTPYTFKNATSN